MTATLPCSKPLTREQAATAIVATAQHLCALGDMVPDDWGTNYKQDQQISIL